MHRQSNGSNEMADSLDRIIDTAKKLRRFAKKTNDPAFLTLIADLTMDLADLKLQLAARAGEPGPAAPAAAREAVPTAATSTVAQVSTKFDSLFGTEPRADS